MGYWLVGLAQQLIGCRLDVVTGCRGNRDTVTSFFKAFSYERASHGEPNCDSCLACRPEFLRTPCRCVFY